MIDIVLYATLGTISGLLIYLGVSYYLTASQLYKTFENAYMETGLEDYETGKSEALAWMLQSLASLVFGILLLGNVYFRVFSKVDTTLYFLFPLACLFLGVYFQSMRSIGATEAQAHYLFAIPSMRQISIVLGVASLISLGIGLRSTIQVPFEYEEAVYRIANEENTVCKERDENTILVNIAGRGSGVPTTYHITDQILGATINGNSVRVDTGYERFSDSPRGRVEFIVPYKVSGLSPGTYTWEHTNVVGRGSSSFVTYPFLYRTDC